MIVASLHALHEHVFMCRLFIPGHSCSWAPKVTRLERGHVSSEFRISADRGAGTLARVAAGQLYSHACKPRMPYRHETQTGLLLMQLFLQLRKCLFGTVYINVSPRVSLGAVTTPPSVCAPCSRWRPLWPQRSGTFNRSRVTRVYSTLSSTTDTALLPSLVCAMWFMLSGVLVRGDRRNRLVEGLGDVVS
jgi:hypothetical protein